MIILFLNIGRPFMRLGKEQATGSERLVERPGHQSIMLDCSAACEIAASFRERQEQF